MLKMKYPDNVAIYPVEFKKISDHLVEVRGNMPTKTVGFTLSRPDTNDEWDYSNFTTVYKEGDGLIIFSDDGTVYHPPSDEMVSGSLEKEEMSLDDLKDLMIKSLNKEQQDAIARGFRVCLSDGTWERFTLTERDQLSFLWLQGMVDQGESSIPWHTEDEKDKTKYYTNEDMQKIIYAARQHVLYHVAYFRDIRSYVRTMTDRASVLNVRYGIDLPEKKKSSPLKDLEKLLK